MLSLETLPKICVALGAAEAAKLQRLAMAACDHGENFLELRLDQLKRPESGIPVVRRLRGRYPDAVLLATCRRSLYGGAFAGSAAEEYSLLARAVEAGADIVDVEVETAEEQPAPAAELRQSCRVMISYHNFEHTPALPKVLRRMRKIPADLYKLATAGVKPSDNLRMLRLPAEWPGERLVCLVMGEVGFPTRVLGPARQAAFVFASAGPPAAGARGAEPTAPGQIPASELRNSFQAHRRTPHTKIYGVIADPVAHSLSPVLHNRAFRARRADAVYVPFRVARNHLSDFFKVAEELPVAGFSVTIPHKERIVRHLGSVDRLAKRIGAVNTVFRRKGRLCGTNTDAIGVTAPLERRGQLHHARVLVVGNGGAARGAIFALSDKGAEVTVTGRNPQRVRRLARACGVQALELAKLGRERFDVLVHATPVGMYPKENECLFDNGIPAELVFDMVYNPLETELVRRARVQGKKVIAGLEMFLEQAAAQFELWTGERAPRTIMRDAVLEALTGKP